MLHIDWSYLYSLVAFVIGGFAGFQGGYEKYNRDSIKVSTTFPGFFYLLSRAAFSDGSICGLLWLWLDQELSFACGISLRRGSGTLPAHQDLHKAGTDRPGQCRRPLERPARSFALVSEPVP